MLCYSDCGSRNARRGASILLKDCIDVYLYLGRLFPGIFSCGTFVEIGKPAIVRFKGIVKG